MWPPRLVLLKNVFLPPYFTTNEPALGNLVKSGVFVKNGLIFKK
jgi:hypothetical protein